MNPPTNPILNTAPPSGVNGSQGALKSRKGFALVVVLLLLAMTTILAVAFAFTMRTERVVASNMVSGQRADMVAQSALHHAISLLSNNIPDPTNPIADTAANEAKLWITNPGRLTIVDSDPGTQDEVIDLFTGPGPATKADTTEAVNLNAQSPVTGKYPITGTNDPMWVKWVNIVADNTKDASIDNRIIGRYAFWIDDESTKINFNTARGKPTNIEAKVKLPDDWAAQVPRDLSPYLHPTFTIPESPASDSEKRTQYTLGHPASVNLDQLGVDIRKLNDEIAEGGFFATPESIKAYVTSDPEVFWEANKFNLTAFSRSPEFNVFGKSRIFFQKSPGDLAAAPMYQHSYTDTQPTIFWGEGAGVSDSSGNERRQVREPAVMALARALERSDWPGFGEKNFSWATSSMGSEESEQIALNISSMASWSVSGAASGSNPYPGAITNRLFRTNWVQGAYPIPSSPNNQIWKGALTAEQTTPTHPMMPPYVGPLLSEIGFQILPEAANTAQTQWYLRIRVVSEFTLPPGHFYSLINDPVTSQKVKGYGNTGSNNYTLRVGPSYMFVEAKPTAGTTYTNETDFLDIQNTPPVTVPPQPTINGFKPAIPDLVPLDDYVERYSNVYYISNLSHRVPVGGGTKSQRAVFTGPVTVTVRLRVAVFTTNGSKVSQILPVNVPDREYTASDAPEDLVVSSEDKKATMTLTFNFDPAAPGAALKEYIQTFEINDPRVTSRENYMKAPTAQEGDGAHSLGEKNPNSTETASSISKLYSWGYAQAHTERADFPLFRAMSIGMLGSIPTGMQRGIQWSTLQLHDYDYGSNVPDWVLLDLVASSPSYPVTYPIVANVNDQDEQISNAISKAKTVFTAPIAWRNSTMGKVNLNAKIYPPKSALFSPPERREPLRAVFRNMPNGTVAADNIFDYQNNAERFDYVGRICEVAGVADESLAADPSNPLDFEKEVLIRNLAGVLATNSNTFGVWGVAQSVKKKVTNKGYGVFEKGDIVTGERRFHAIVERYIWTGADGVPGNGTVNDSGAYIATTGPGKMPGAQPAIAPASQWAMIDGKQEATIPAVAGTIPFEESALDAANNPLAAAMKYRVIYMEYVD